MRTVNDMSNARAQNHCPHAGGGASGIKGVGTGNVRVGVSRKAQNVVEYGLLIVGIVVLVLLGVAKFGSVIEPWFAQRYPGQFGNGQLRTLQRHIAVWRAKTVLSFDDDWTDAAEQVEQESLPRPLRV